MKKTVRNVFIGLGVFILLAISSVFFYVNNVLGKIENVNLDEKNLGINEGVDSKYSHIKNIALFGVDAVDGGHGRSDSIMVLTLNSKDKSIKLTSLMRDSYVSIDGHGKDKLNHAYAFGGPELAMKTINQNFDLNIKDFVTVNFETLPKIIDALGGVEIEIDSDEIKEVNKYISEMNQINKANSKMISSAGVQLLDGNQVMGYSRVRYTEGGDYRRTQRHRKVLTGVFEKFKDVDLLKVPNLINQVVPMVKTSLDTNKMISLANDGLKAKGGVQQERFPKDNNSEGKTIGGVYYLTYNEAQTKSELHKWIFGE
ncbi:MAG: LCP family protein [Sarcina sp.]